MNTYGCQGSAKLKSHTWSISSTFRIQTLIQYVTLHETPAAHIPPLVAILTSVLTNGDAVASDGDGDATDADAVLE